MAHTHKTDKGRETGTDIKIGQSMHVHRIGRQNSSPERDVPGHTHFLGDAEMSGPIEKDTNVDLAKELKSNQK